MDKKMTNIKERVLYIAELKGISKESFFDELGLSYANFKGKQKNSALNSDAVDKILTKYHDISADWLVMDKGDVFRNKKPPERSGAEASYKDKYIEVLEKNVELMEENRRLQSLVSKSETIMFPAKRAYHVAEDDPERVAKPAKKLEKSKDR